MRDLAINVLLILPILLGFGLLIFVHELGHFLAAKWAGIRTDGFAVGMGPVAVSWRKGVGFAAGSTDRRTRERYGKPAIEMSDAELAANGVGETEYSLRWLPIGGFVKMLGQEDLRPVSASAAPRHYQSCPIGKRMVVVSAGVIFNVILALILFAVAFMVGVKLPAPYIGDVAAGAPAALAVPLNADDLGITEPGLRAGDRVVAIDGTAPGSYSDLQLAAAMARPGRPIELAIDRAGYDTPLMFSILPEEGNERILSIGVTPDYSTRLYGGRDAEVIMSGLSALGLDRQGLRPGMRVTEVEGVPVTSYGQFVAAIDAAPAETIETTWSDVDPRGESVGPPVTVMIGKRLEFDTMIQPSAGRDSLRNDPGLLGLTPLVLISGVEGANEDRLRTGDVILAAGGVPFPRLSEVQSLVAEHAGGDIDLRVRRDGLEQAVTARVSGAGRIGIYLRPYEDEPVIATTVETRVSPQGEGDPASTPAAALNPMPGSRILAVGDTPVADWPEFRAAVHAATRAAAASGGGASIVIRLASPVADAAPRDVTLPLDADEVARLHALSWQAEIDGSFFAPLYTRLTADGNPILAVQMGLRETTKMIVLTYLTIDRLFRGSVKVSQLRGPVGIVHIGTQVLPQGFMYFLFLLGVISVNLAVLNFLPLPIVDGGLFLYLLYEKFKGRPPSVGFQNAATLVGLALIGTIFVVTFYNDIGRLFAG